MPLVSRLRGPLGDAPGQGKLQAPPRRRARRAGRARGSDGAVLRADGGAPVRAPAPPEHGHCSRREHFERAQPHVLRCVSHAIMLVFHADERKI